MMEEIGGSLLSLLADSGVAILDKDITMQEAITKITDCRSNFGIFLDNGYPIGLITERDIIKNLITGQDREQSAFGYATKSVISVKENRSIEYAIFLMTENNIKRLVVCNYEGKFVGVLTQDTITKYLNTHLNKNKLRAIHLVRGKGIITMEDSSSLYQVAASFYRNKIGIMPLINGGCMSGVLTDTDILKFAKTGVDFTQKASTLMSSPSITVNEFATIEEILTIFEHYGIKHVVVASNNCAPIGIISKRDIIRNMNENYYRMLEKKAKNFKVAINTLASPAMELFYDGNEFIIEWYNKACLEVFGQDMFDRALREFVDEGVILFIKDVIKDGSAQKELVYTHNNDVFDVKVAVLNENTISLVFNNITKYHNSREFIQSLFDMLPQMIVVTDGKRLVYANKSMLKFFGKKSVEEFLEESSCICDHFIPDSGYLDKGIDGSWVRKSFSTTELGAQEKAKIADVNGNARIFGVDTKRFSDEGAIYVSSFSDITDAESYKMLLSSQNEILESMVEKRTLELNISKKLLEKAQEVSKIGSCIFDVRSKEIECYGEVASVLGAPCAPKNFKEFMSFFDAQSINKITDMVSEIIFSKKEHSIQVILQSGDDLKVLFIKAEPYEIENKIVTKVFGTVQDISEQVELSKKAHYDNLTGIYNRNKIDSVKELLKISTSISFVLFDIDKFKPINDTYGHQKGDCALREIATLVGHSIRESDIFIRWGGEEFLVVLPGCKMERAKEIAEELRVLIESATICDLPTITCSFGIGSMNGKNDSFEAILGRADAALYVAKEGGRNRVECDAS